MLAIFKLEKVVINFLLIYSNFFVIGVVWKKKKFVNRSLLKESFKVLSKSFVAFDRKE